MKARKTKKPEEHVPLIYLITMIIIGATFFAPLSYFKLRKGGYQLSDIWIWFADLVPGPLAVDLAFLGIIAFPLTIILMFFGSFIVRLALLPLIIATVLLDWMERHAAGGMVGVIGFILFLVGTSLKSYLDWVGLPQ